jgi:hypothetical protein
MKRVLITAPLDVRSVPVYDDQQSTISSLSTGTAFDPPTIAALSTNSPTTTTTTTTNATTTTSQLGLSMSKAIDSIRPFVRPDEDASIWAPWFSGLAGRSPSLKDTLLGLVELWKAPVEEDKEPTLYQFLEVAERWLIDYSHIHIKQVPANFRNRLAVFESHEFGNTKYRGCFYHDRWRGSIGRSSSYYYVMLGVTLIPCCWLISRLSLSLYNRAT